MSMVSFRCPHCGQSLAAGERTFSCPSGHQFDRAREGYVHLLPSGRLAGGPSGDDDTMVRARRAVFDAGCYDPIIDAVAAAVAATGAADVLDAGCGEGTYLARAVEAAGATGWGIDISKVAVKLAARRYAACSFAVASSYRLPFDDGQFGALIDVFSPRPFDELLRVLRPGGVAVVVTPGADHLAQLKALLYDTPRPHVDDEVTPAATDVTEVRFTVDLAEPALRRHLLEMTPYWWSADDDRRARVEVSLTSVDAHMVLTTYTKP
ncbi:MAG: rRNA ((745)-N(1))-methyltransferase [Actinomycetota bacterium]|jgi:23S rRNA (guanine745-N1)-methyltransferase